MPELTRRRSPDHREEWWEIYYGDIHAGTIAERTGNTARQYYPRCHSTLSKMLFDPGSPSRFKTIRVSRCPRLWI